MGVLLDELRAAPECGSSCRSPGTSEGAAWRVLDAPGVQATLAQLSEGSGGSPRTIERLFCSETETSFGRWRQQVRLMHAVRLLCDGVSVTEAELEVGTLN